MTLLFRVYRFNTGVVLSLILPYPLSPLPSFKEYPKKALMYCDKFAMKKASSLIRSVKMADSPS
jgi:hypothetical protein